MIKTSVNCNQWYCIFDIIDCNTVYNGVNARVFYRRQRSMTPRRTHYRPQYNIGKIIAWEYSEISTSRPLSPALGVKWTPKVPYFLCHLHFPIFYLIIFEYIKRNELVFTHYSNSILLYLLALLLLISFLQSLINWTFDPFDIIGISELKMLKVLHHPTTFLVMIISYLNQLIPTLEVPDFT